RDAQRQRVAVLHELAAADQVYEPRSGLVGGILVGSFKQDAELVTADSGHDVAVADAAGKQVGDLDQRLVTRAVTEGVVDHLEAIEVDEQHRRVDSVAVYPPDQPLELTHKAP